MERLNEKQWKAFELQELFPVIEATKGKTTAGLVDGDDLPYIAAAKSITGCQVCSAQANDEWKSAGNGMVFVQLGDGAAGLAHYIPMDFIGMSGKTSVGYSEKLNPCNGVFISRCLSANKAIFSHGHSWTGKRLRGSKNMLPVDDEGRPDYAYMTLYSTEMSGGMLMRYKNFIAGQLSQLEHKDIPALNEKEWGHFLIPDVFSNIQRGKRLKNADHVPGIIPYVSSTANNNGVDDYVKATAGTRSFSDCISLANSGSVGTAFYEPFEFVASDHVTSLKREGTSKFVYLFLATTIERQGSNFNFNREINDARIKKMQVMLPVTDAGRPDYEYMEQYIKNMMLHKYEQYLGFIER